MKKEKSKKEKSKKEEREEIRRLKELIDSMPESCANAKELLIKRPVRLSMASEILRKLYPEHYRDVKQLRTLCEKSIIPHENQALCGTQRINRFLVRIEELVAHWKKQHKSA